MITSQFDTWQAHAKTLSIESLQYVIADCKNARDAMKGWNPEKENYYQDQYLTYLDELRMRTAK
jgi:hypothetical protein